MLNLWGILKNRYYARKAGLGKDLIMVDKTAGGSRYRLFRTTITNITSLQG
jgi:hypothetical protein